MKVLGKIVKAYSVLFIIYKLFKNFKVLQLILAL